ncbi:MAG: glycoside hydrolase domain-containing protein [Chitinophagaceae bacterium]
MNRLIFLLYMLSRTLTNVAQTTTNGEDSGLLKVASVDDQSKWLLQFPGKTFIVVPERRELPITQLDFIPGRWLKRSAAGTNEFYAEAQPGEFFVFQLGIFANRFDLTDIHISFEEVNNGKNKIAAAAFTCFNQEGIDIMGKMFAKKLKLQKNRVLPMWIGLNIPGNAEGVYRSKIFVHTDKGDDVIQVGINVMGQLVANQGVDDASTLSRLQWLNSTIAQNHMVTKGFTAVERTATQLRILGRSLVIGKQGLPQKITSYFIHTNQQLGVEPKQILADAMQIVVELQDGSKLSLQPGKLIITTENKDAVTWQVLNSSTVCDVLCKGSLEFDGWGSYQVELIPKKNIVVKDVRLKTAITKEMSAYMMGLGREGGYRPEQWSWKWDVANKGQDAVWMGGVNGGLRLKLLDTNYVRPLVNIYYAFGPLKNPMSWYNENKGGVVMNEQGNQTRLKCFSGSRSLVKGERLHFNFELLITPMKLISKDRQFADRYYHSDSDVSSGYIDAAEKAGANIINIHHKKDINPYINYPYLQENVTDLRRFIDNAHKKNIRTKLYYTTRELTVNMPEFWAFRSLEGELIYPGAGKDAKTLIHPKGPPEWLSKNVHENFIPAWVATFNEGKYKGHQDLSVITTPDSRLNNFYLEGLSWMVKNLQVDGMYIDDAALDRNTLRRARKILEGGRPAPRIDLHSWNHFNKIAGWSSCLNLYMDLLPYIDLVWIGEGRNYNRAPDHWLVEISGIPFGNAGQMLGGNGWRGMVYGITDRAGWTRDSAQQHLWKLWDAVRIQDMEMLGYWDPACPARTDNDSVKVSVFKGAKKSLLAIANWTKVDQICNIKLDARLMGAHDSRFRFVIPAIETFQPQQTLQSLDGITIPAGKGFVILVERQ